MKFFHAIEKLRPNTNIKIFSKSLYNLCCDWASRRTDVLTSQVHYVLLYYIAHCHLPYETYNFSDKMLLNFTLAGTLNNCFWWTTRSQSFINTYFSSSGMSMTYLLSTMSSESTVPHKSSNDSSFLAFFLEDSLVVTGVEGGLEISSSLEEVDTSSSARLRFGGRPAGLSLTGVLALKFTSNYLL